MLPNPNVGHLILKKSCCCCYSCVSEVFTTLCQLPFFITCLRTFFLYCQSSQVKLWWPNGHGDQAFYKLSVRGFQDGILILNTESKVRVHTQILNT